MKVLKKLEKSFGTWFLIFTSFFFFVLRIPSLFEPYWYGDEGIYQVLGLSINSGGILYRDAFDNKPPLLYVFYSFFNSDQFMVRLASLVFGVLAVVAFYFLAKKLLEKKLAVYFSTGFFAFIFAIPFIEGNIANAENLMLFPLILAGLLIYSISQKINNKILFISGLLVGISFLFKVIAVFDFAAFFLFLLFSDLDFKFSKLRGKKYLLQVLDKASIFILGFILPISLASIYFYYVGAFSYFLKATLLNNVGYVGYGNKFIIPQGFLILKLIILSLFTLFVFIKKKSLGFAGIFIFLWVGFSLFNAFFSQRPYTHYVLVFLPSFSLLLGFFLANKKWQKFSLVFILVLAYLIFKNFHLYDKVIPYYKNFITFADGKKSLNDYQAFFDKRTPIDYQIVQYLSTKINNENVFIWGNNAQVYKMLGKLPPGRYAVAYHISGYKDGLQNAKEGLEKSPPKYIVVMPNAKTYPFSLDNYKLSIILSDVMIYEKVF
ncbi:MAG: glycosyltransferase family 39 protein [Candidatus Levyibacteriota bacterium]